MANIERSVEYTQTRPDGTGVTKTIPYVNNDVAESDVTNFVTGVSALSKNTLTGITDVKKQGLDLLQYVNTTPNITFGLQSSQKNQNYGPGVTLRHGTWQYGTLINYADNCQTQALSSLQECTITNYGNNFTINYLYSNFGTFTINDYGKNDVMNIYGNSYSKKNKATTVANLYGNNCKYNSYVASISGGVAVGIQNTTLSVYGNDCAVDIRGTNHNNKILVAGENCKLATNCYIDPANTANPPKSTITINGGAQNTKIALSNSTEYRSNVDIYNLTDDVVILRNLPNTIAADAPARTWNHELINDNADTRITLGYDSNESPLAVLTLYGRNDGVVKIIESDSWSDTDYLKTYTIA